MRADNSVEVHVDGEQSFKGSLLSDMQPPVNPPKAQGTFEVKTQMEFALVGDLLYLFIYLFVYLYLMSHAG